MRMNIDVNSESFAFLDSSRFWTSDWCKARITALALPDRTSNSLSCLPSLANATPRYLNFSTCFNDTQPTCREHWNGFIERCNTSILEELIFIPAMSHTAAKPFSACWRPAKLNYLRKATELVSHLPIVTHSSIRLSLFVQFM